MSIDIAIASFTNKLTIPLFADLTRTLEVTCHSQGDDNHGSNFVGNAVVLSAIETVAQFTDPTTVQERQDFGQEAKLRHKALASDVKPYVSPKYSPIDGSQLAVQFMRDYFGEPIANGKEFGTPVRDLVWAFRNPHMHAFYPYYRKTFNTKQISGGVAWLYFDEINRIGIRIAQVEEQFDLGKDRVYQVRDDWFLICPQILFVFFKKAVALFIAAVPHGGDAQNRFLDNYRRLTSSYGFQELPT